MLKNYFKSAWRSLVRGKGYSLLNILGLGTGMAVALLIGLWVYNEWSYDRFLPGYAQLYEVKQNGTNNGEISTFPSASLMLVDALRTEFPEIKSVAETDWMGSHGLVVGDKKIYLNGAQTGSEFLTMFRFPLLEGQADLVLKDPYSIVLTQSTATSLFGTENAVGKMVRVDNLHDLKVTGILKDLPKNSTFQFNYVIPFSYYAQVDPNVRTVRATEGWGGNAFHAFVELRPGVNYAQFADRLKGVTKRHVPTANVDVILQSVKNWHLYGQYENGKEVEGFMAYVRLFGIIGVIVLLIACINFINLSTARSEKRAKEVGVRKAIGSQRKDLIFQFLTESFLTTVLALIFALGLMVLALPAFNNLTGTAIAIPFSSVFFWLILLTLVILTSLIAGSRPAFYLSSFNPVRVLKGGMRAGKAATLPRKILVVAQFSCSIALIISTLLVYRQIQYVRDRPTGYNLNRLMQTDLNEDLLQHYTPLKNELLQSGLAESVTTASSPATDIYWHTGLDNWPGKSPGQTMVLGAVRVSEDYFTCMGMSLAKGRYFTGNAAADSANIIINETAVERLHLKQPINQSVAWNGRSFRIVGVIKDALILSPFKRPEPMMFLYDPGGASFVLYRLSPSVKTQDAIVRLTALFAKYNPAYPYIYTFADESYAAKFSLEVLIGKLAAVFAGLAIFVSCLGLFGLAAYTAEQRTKEIGIRKVLGASVSQVWVLLSREFVVLVLMSCVIASPLALYFLTTWLLKFDYRITIGPGVFILAGVIALLITVITISSQAIKAAVANPVKSLRAE